jgi:hypothetical protein
MRAAVNESAEKKKEKLSDAVESFLKNDEGQKILDDSIDRVLNNK